MTAVDKFREIAAQAIAQDRVDSSAPDIIPFGAAMVELAQTHPADQSAFEAEFIALTKKAPPELLEFCMHALRWESLRSYFQERQKDAIATNDWRAEPFYRHLVEAFDDNWPDAADFYASYFRK